MRKLVLTLAAVALSLGVLAAPIAAATGRSVEAKSSPPPDHIVSLSPTATEMLFAIGAAKQVVAVDDQSNYPKQAPRTKLSGFNVNVEATTQYSPDLVVLSDGAAQDQFKTLGIKTLVLTAAKQLTDTYRQINQLGTLTGHVAAAKDLVAKIRGKIADAVAQVPSRKTKPTTYYELDDTFFSVKSSTFIGSLLKLAGLKNIADQAKGSDYPQLSAEYVVSTDPDVIFLADTKCCNQSAATIAARAGFDGVRAVKQHHVVALDDDIASRWGPRVTVLLDRIVQATKKL
jgi:iron complex transport system substrate-binding protein